MNIVKLYYRKEQHHAWKIHAIYRFHRSPLDFIDELYHHLKDEVENTFKEYKIVRPNQQTWGVAASYPYSKKGVKRGAQTQTEESLCPAEPQA